MWYSGWGNYLAPGVGELAAITRIEVGDIRGVRQMSLFTLLTQVVFRQIDHPGHRVRLILRFGHLLRQSVRGSGFQLGPVASAREEHVMCLVD